MGIMNKVARIVKDTAEATAQAARADIQEKDDAAAALKKKRQDLESEGVVYCPKCLSTQVTSDKKGFGLGKAVVGNAVLPGIGLLAGAIGKNKRELHCMKCGNKFKA